MKVGFWIWDFHAFEIEVQMNMDLIGKRRKISVAISEGKDSHRINLLLLLLSDIAAFRERKGGGFWLRFRKSCRWVVRTKSI